MKHLVWSDPFSIVHATHAHVSTATDDDEGDVAAGLVFTSVFDNPCCLRAAILPLPLLAPPLHIVGIEGAGGGGA